MTLTKRQLLAGLSVSLAVVSYFFFPLLAKFTKPLSDAHSELMASSDRLFLDSYVTCLVKRPQCRQAYNQIATSGPAFPAELTLLFLFSLGGLVLVLFAYRPETRLYGGSLATRKDMGDLRIGDWLSDPRAGTSIVLGQHVGIPETGDPRKQALRGHSKRGTDKQMLMVKPGYGGRPELPLGAVFGTTRSGKTMHLTAQAIRWTDSFVALDIKGEIYKLTAGIAAKRAGEGGIFVLSPDGRGHQFDALAEMMKTAAGISTAAYIIAAPHKEKGNGVYFAEKAAQGIAAAFYAARSLQTPPFDLLYELVLAGGMGSYVGRLRAIDDPNVRFALNKFLDPHGGDDFNLERALEERSLTNSWSTMIRSLEPFLGTNIRWLLRRSDFRARDLMQKKVYVYLQFPETTLEATSKVYDLIMTSLTRSMFDYVGGELNLKQPKVRVLLLLDEVSAAPITALPTLYATAAGRHITPILYCQSPLQLDDLYGIKASEALLSNCGVKLYYKTESYDTAKRISDISGKVSRTEKRKSRRWRPVPSFEAPMISEGNQSREVISPDEVLLVGGEKREVILAHVTGKPITVVRRVNPYTYRRIRRLLKTYPAPKIPVPTPAALALEEQPVTSQSETIPPAPESQESTKKSSPEDFEPAVVQPQHRTVARALENRQTRHDAAPSEAESDAEPRQESSDDALQREGREEVKSGTIQLPLNFDQNVARSAQELSVPPHRKEHEDFMSELSEKMKRAPYRERGEKQAKASKKVSP